MLIKIMEKVLLHFNEAQKENLKGYKKKNKLAWLALVWGGVAYIHNGSLIFFSVVGLHVRFFLKLRFTARDVPFLCDTTERDRAVLQALSSPRNGGTYARNVQGCGLACTVPGAIEEQAAFLSWF